MGIAGKSTAIIIYLKYFFHPYDAFIHMPKMKADPEESIFVQHFSKWNSVTSVFISPLNNKLFIVQNISLWYICFSVSQHNIIWQCSYYITFLANLISLFWLFFFSIFIYTCICVPLCKCVCVYNVLVSQVRIWRYTWQLSSLIWLI